MIDYVSPYGEFVLTRPSEQKNETLQAWDTADLYLLSYLRESIVLCEKRVLIVNDLFGAITVPMLAVGATCFSVSDSYISQKAYFENCRRNNIDEKRLSFIDETRCFPEDIDIVLMKIPKSLAHLQEQLCRIKAVINSEAVIVAADKTKNIHNSTIALFKKIIGETKTSLAWKKSRIIHSTNQMVNRSGDQLPEIVESNYELKEWKLTLRSKSSVFSQGKLDQGTAFLLHHLVVGDEAETIVDLACGNGVIGLVAKRLNPKACVIFVDESYMAVESAKQNYATYFSDSTAQFVVDDCLSSLLVESSTTGTVDRVLCNPPFHQQKAMGKQTAHRMFQQAFELLIEGGELWVIANRHLAYHTVLKRRFGHCTLVSGNSKFVVLRSIKQGDR
ncbi:MAG: methyltransferase [Pseudomonadales bacterium]|nr:methyltransferase [Pseudomonadales bacterium]